MKDKILVFIIGLLVGAVITASGFLIYQNVNKNTKQMPSGEQMQMMEKPDGQEPPEMPNGQNGQPPAMPNGQNPQQSSNNS